MVPVAEAAARRLAAPGVVEALGVADCDGVVETLGVVEALGVPEATGVAVVTTVLSPAIVETGSAPVTAALGASAARLEIAASPMVLSCWEVRWLSAVAVTSSAEIGTPQAVTSRKVAIGRSGNSRAMRRVMR
jgi:hypothetical protein